MSSKNKEKRRQRPHVRSGLQVGVVALFAVVGAIALGSLAPTIFNGLFQFFSSFQRPPAAVEPGPPQQYPAARSFGSVLPLAILGGLTGAWIGNLVYSWLAKTIERWDKMAIGDKVNLFLGIFAGFVLALPFLFLFNSLPIQTVYIPFMIVGLTMGFSALSIYVLQSIDDVLPWSKNRGKARRTGIKILDTNVIIDGRIYDVVRAGFLEGEMYIPGFVLDELQYIADDHNALRRQRGRRGLEVLKHLQADFPLEVRVHDRFAGEGNEPVDSRLVRLAKAIGADIVTNDFNLNRVASLQDVKVLNLNDLALALRPNVLPQESLCLSIIREGNQPGQGVGYLDDGTMVVVENGKGHIGETLDVMVTQVIQTERGKLIFGEIREEASPQPELPKKPRKPH